MTVAAYHGRSLGIPAEELSEEGQNFSNPLTNLNLMKRYYCTYRE